MYSKHHSGVFRCLVFIMKYGYVIGLKSEKYLQETKGSKY